MVPIILRLKRKAHREIAKAQDLIVEALYEAFDGAVLHGGTSIWRCYKGNRFSEDVDVYITRDLKKIEQLFENFKNKGFSLEKERVKEKSIYSTLKLNGTLVRFEALFKKGRGSLKEYETSEGNFLTVYTLMPEELIREKISAYLERCKVRDLYDIFFLLRYVQDISPIKNELKYLVAKFKNAQDEKELKALLLEGVTPTSQEMLTYIKNKVR